MSRSIPSAVVLLVVAVSVATAVGQGPPAPSTVGDVVLLSERPEGAGPKLKAALTSPDPRVRTAAARVVGTIHASEMLSPLSVALAEEQDPEPGAEQVRALLMLNGRTLAPMVERHAVRLGGAAARVHAEWLALNTPESLIERLDVLAPAAAAGNDSIRAAVVRAARATSVVNAAALRKWRAVAPEDEWKAALTEALRFDADIQLTQDVIIEALAFPRPAIRQDTIWYLLGALATGHSLPRPVLAAVERPASVSDWESYGRELLVRYGRRAEPITATSFLEQEPSHHRLRALGRLKILDPAETRLVSTRDSDLLTVPPAPMASPHASSGRTIEVWLSGLVADLASAAGCKVSTEFTLALARVTYRADGRIQKVETDVKKLKGECVPVFHALLRTMIADVGDAGEGRQQLVLLPFTEDFVRCTARPVGQVLRAGVDLGAPPVPRKIRDVRLNFSSPVLRMAQPGIHIADVTIAASGCTRDVRVTHPGGDARDLSVLQAVSQWMFEPPLAEGKPMPVRITVTFDMQPR